MTVYLLNDPKNLTESTLIFVLIGVMAVNIVPESIAGWRGLALLGAMLTVPLTLMLLLVSESPFYLLKSG